jgi:hypothetical protein
MIEYKKYFKLIINVKTGKNILILILNLKYLFNLFNFILFDHKF